MKRTAYEDRQWLNKKGQGRSTVTFLYDGYCLGGDWTIGDCNRQIQLDFNVYLNEREPSGNDREFNEKLRKLDLITKQLQKLRESMVKGYEAYKTEEKPKPKSRRVPSLTSLLRE